MPQWNMRKAMIHVLYRQYIAIIAASRYHTYVLYIGIGLGLGSTQPREQNSRVKLKAD